MCTSSEGSERRGTPDLCASKPFGLSLSKPVRDSLPRAVQSAHTTSPLQAVPSTIRPNTIRYQAKGMKLWVEI